MDTETAVLGKHRLQKITPWPGTPYPLGATYDGEGTNFALFSDKAEEVELVLFDPLQPSKVIARHKIEERTDHVFHIYLPTCPVGTLYGFRVFGPWDPANGKLFNEHKVLLDPYAKAINGTIDWHPSMFGYPMKGEGEDRILKKDTRNNEVYASKAVVIDGAYDWEGDALLKRPMHQTVIYECHVKGISMLHPDLPDHLRGTYAALAHPVMIDYFKKLGVTAIELMPIHHFIHDQHLVKNGLRNYWGYNTIGFFAPHSEYASTGSMGEQVREFKDMVKALHKAGLEVILDVVYNHTGEGNHFGPTLSFKGIDNQSYYRLSDEAKYYKDYTGTGNTLNMLHPRVLQLVMDSLRYWVNEMHIDGFRFDLASALARGLYDVGRLSTFLDTIHQDPVISQVKLIAEPWDVGPGGYQVGNFPVLWSEWNGKYRDCVRSFWRGDESKVAEMAYRLSGSSDLYQADGRRPSASINFVTCHDGFPLNDLVSYNEKHNEANLEGNRDGESHNLSFNFGVEGPTDDPEIRALRRKQQRNFLATLFLSQGVPMLSMGDEYGRTQGGNNNVYCQDNDLSYFNWNWSEEEKEQFEFVRKLIAIRQKNRVLHRRRFFAGRPIHGQGIGDILWLQPNGEEMNDDNWNNGLTRCLGMVLNGEAMDERDEKGRPITNDIFLVLLNGYWENVDFTLPGQNNWTRWQLMLDTMSSRLDHDQKVDAGTEYTLNARSFSLFRLEAKHLEADGRPRPLLTQLRKLLEGRKKTEQSDSPTTS